MGYDAIKSIMTLPKCPSLFQWLTHPSFPNVQLLPPLTSLDNFIDLYEGLFDEDEVSDLSEDGREPDSAFTFLSSNQSKKKRLQHLHNRNKNLLRNYEPAQMCIFGFCGIESCTRKTILSAMKIGLLALWRCL